MILKMIIDGGRRAGRGGGRGGVWREANQPSELQLKSLMVSTQQAAEGQGQAFDCLASS